MCALVLGVLLTWAVGAGCAPGSGMTPERAQATVTAFAVQRAATAQAQARQAQVAATATAHAQAAATATTQALEARRQAEATATALAQPTPTPTGTPTPTPTAASPAPTPTGGPRSATAAEGSGTVQLRGDSASFNFAVSRRPDGQVEGQLVYASGRGTLRASAFTALEVETGLARFSGFGTFSDLPARVTFTVIARSSGQGGDGGSLRMVVSLPNGQEFLAESGPLVRGAIAVAQP
ncbi:MAG: hypothetical protein HY689_14935 [Chloroflexi bacterium]|nr:hypothetical protein [Chloroflexota bacterium]